MSPPVGSDSALPSRASRSIRVLGALVATAGGLAWGLTHVGERSASTGYAVCLMGLALLVPMLYAGVAIKKLRKQDPETIAAYLERGRNSRAATDIDRLRKFLNTLRPYLVGIGALLAAIAALRGRLEGVIVFGGMTLANAYPYLARRKSGDSPTDR
jgi:high-affinity Fe2+/Pb2+ permease